VKVGLSCLKAAEDKSVERKVSTVTSILKLPTWAQVTRQILEDFFLRLYQDKTVHFWLSHITTSVKLPKSEVEMLSQANEYLMQLNITCEFIYHCLQPTNHMRMNMHHAFGQSAEKRNRKACNLLLTW